ncbi:phosphatidylserine/phosphatidylglycerophosphate/cardiolipin synthase family protein, partial [Myxococcota bacterium]|nr:phosphatidylserine/phosphatidylglycerophosphate/cardiolipin synthase family protein [Myxococcota bacterium]
RTGARWSFETPADVPAPIDAPTDPGLAQFRRAKGLAPAIAEAMRAGTLHAPAHDYPKNEAVRPPRVGLGATLGVWLGLSAPMNHASQAALLGAAGLGPQHLHGAALDEPIGVPAIAPELAASASRIRRAIGRFTTDVSALMHELRERTPIELAKLDEAFGRGWGGRFLSLREAIGTALRGVDRKAALTRLEEAFAIVRRADAAPLHDLAADPSGLAGPSHDGRLPQTIDKVLELRRLGFTSRADVVNRHELVPGNDVQLLPGGKRAFEAVLKAIDAAEDFVHVSFFIFKDDAHGKLLAAKLVEKAKQGVKVRVSFDEGGDLFAKSASARRLMKRLEKAGVEVGCNWIVDASRETSLINAPDHRKIVVVDGKVAFTGGMNVGTDYITEWHDHFVEVRGPAVHQLGVEWMTGWLALGGVIDAGASDADVRARYFPPAPAAGDARIKVAQTIPGESDEILRSYLQLIDGAESSIWIESPYISATEIQEALLRAVTERGVDVHVIIPGDNNHPACEHAARPALRALVGAGANVYAYDGMNHAKVMAIDGRFAIIGTANLDALSLKRVYEVNLHIDDAETVRRVQAEIFQADLAKAKRLSVADLEVGAFLAEPFYGAMAPLL